MNPHFHRLFEAVSDDGESFWSKLKKAVADDGEWGSTCCPGASDESGPRDDVAACKPPLVQECALFMRRNDPPAAGQLGYQVYAVAYQSKGTWVPVPETGGTTAYATFAASMSGVGIESICFERDS